MKVDFVNYPYKWIDAELIEDSLTLATPKDIAAMKLSAITNRGTKKDFIDLYELLAHFPLKQLFEFYQEKYTCFQNKIFYVWILALLDGLRLWRGG